MFSYHLMSFHTSELYYFILNDVVCIALDVFEKNVWYEISLIFENCQFHTTWYEILDCFFLISLVVLAGKLFLVGCLHPALWLTSPFLLVLPIS
jgi:hypothetical protein